MSELLRRKQRKQAMIFSEREDDIVVEDNSSAAIRIDIIQAESEQENEGEDKIQHDAPVFVNDAKMLFNEQSHESEEEG